ncbi:MAG: DNA polymerase/3'-5' exonuclease PolX, partial [Chloroflexota bacterium]
RNAQIAAGLREIADLLEMTEENIFRIRAYRRAADAVEGLAEPVSVLLARDPAAIPGVGASIADHIKEIETTGTTALTTTLHQQYPASVTALLQVPGVGPKLAARAYRELGVATLADLEIAAGDGRLAALTRVGAKTAASILRNIAAFKERTGRLPLGEALPLVERVMAALNAGGGLRRLDPAGSVRRYQETVGDLDLVGVADEPLVVMEALVKLPEVERVLGSGSTKTSVILAAGLQLDLRLVEAEDYGSLLQHFTGNKQHNIQLREYAVARGLKISEYGIENTATGAVQRFQTEEALYAALDLQYIPPELRQGTDEIQLALRHALPRLVELADMRGDLHMHTEWSDGTATIDQMIQAARARGYRYMAISDHSGGLGIARGLTPERLRAQIAAVREAAARYPDIQVFTASEVDIRADGAMDFPDDVLAELDLVIGSIHSAMNQSPAEATARLLRAIENPHVDIIGHPSTRIVGGREGVEFDRMAVFAAAARTGTAMEVNANPSRLDLRDADIRLALEVGVKLTIDTDAHAVDGLDLMEYGVRTARRGGARREDIWNAAPLEELTAWLGRDR